MTQFGPWQDAIYERLNDNIMGRVFIEGIPMNTQVPMDPTGLIAPMVVVWFGHGLITDPRFGGICGVENNLTNAIVIIEVIAGNGRALLRLENEVRDLLTGFRPNGEGQLHEEGSASVRDPSAVGLGLDIRFYKSVAYRGMVNA